MRPFEEGIGSIEKLDYKIIVILTFVEHLKNKMLMNMQKEEKKDVESLMIMDEDRLNNYICYLQLTELLYDSMLDMLQRRQRFFYYALPS